MNTVRVSLGERSYPIVISSSTTVDIGSFAASRTSSRRTLIVTDDRVADHLPAVSQSLENAGFTTASCILPAGEAQKSLNTASSLYDHLVDIRADRKTLVVALGGGVIGDLAGFVAATFNRGLPLLMVPTTLLAMVDSSVGGKVGVNHPRGKNLIGSFHQPAGVWIDTSFLDTLPEREYRSGLAEVVKYGVLLDADFLTYLESIRANVLARDPATVRHIVTRSCELKACIVEQDEFETKGLRVALNYGHTFAHAFETVGGYGAWLHGEAVAAGMVCASRLAQRRGLIQPADTQRQIELLRAFSLPTEPRDWPLEELLSVMRSDKKNVGGRMRFVLPVRIGEVKLFDDVDEQQVREVLALRNPEEGNH